MKRTGRTAPQCTGTNALGLRCGLVPLPDSERCHLHPLPSTAITIPTVLDPEPEPEDPKFEVTNAADFAKAILESLEFRQYVVLNLKNGKLPAAIVLRFMDYAEGWGKPPERIEHTGKDGDAIITEVRRVIVHAQEPERPEIPNHPDAEPLFEMGDDGLDQPLIPIAPRRSH